MRRRQFITLLGSAAAAWPLAARAQQPAVPVIGILGQSTPATAAGMAGYLAGLKDGGYEEGRNLMIDYRWAYNQTDRLSGLAADLVQRQVKVILTGGTPAALAAKAATATIPIVFQLGADPVKLGLVPRLNRPGGNITGITNIAGTLAAKRLEILHQLAPDASTIGVLIDPRGPSSDTQKSEVQEAAGALDLKIAVLNATNDEEIDAAFATIVKQRIGALLLEDFTLFNSRREQLVALARFNRVPTMYTFREFAVAGGLISYASSVTDASRLAGSYVARILKGEKPGDLPVQQPTKFELVINLKTAKSLGLSVPDTLLALADQVIE